MTAPADGNAGAGDAAGSFGEIPRPNEAYGAQNPRFADSDRNDGQQGQVSQGVDLGPNFERLEEERPELVNALRELVRQYRVEGVAARMHEIRRIRQARLFWQGLQYAWWNPNDMNWHLPFEQKFNDDRTLEEMPRYQFVTNFYQGFGLSFVAVLSQDVPSVRFYPQSAQSLVDIAAARAASDVAELIERNNHVEQLLTSIGYFLWTDGKVGAYVRFVKDGQRFGFREEEILAAVEIPLGVDTWVCPSCGRETPVVGYEEVQNGYPRSAISDQETIQDAGNLPRSLDSGLQKAQTSARDDNFGFGENDGAVGSGAGTGHNPESAYAVDLAGESLAPEGVSYTCPGCGAELGERDLRRAERVTVPRVVETRRVANGQEVISIAGGLELNTPVWANEMHEYPYLQWQAEVHRAKLKAAYPLAAGKIESAPSQGPEDVYARVSRLSVEQGLPSIHPGDALMNLITFDRTWLRPWAFYGIENEEVRNELLALFPDGCYVGFAGDVYCEARNESMDDHWRVLHALPGDGQNRPSVGDSLVQVQERYNTLSNMQAETYEYGIPPIYADPQVLDFDALANQVAEPAAHFPARARPGQPLAAGFFQPAPAQVPPDMIRHQQDLIGPVSQFLTGLFPAVFGGNMEDVKTASGYAMARDQAMGRLGLVWRRLKQFYGEVMLLGVDCFRKNRPEDVDVPLLGPDGTLDARMIRVGDLKGNICVHPEADETFPRLKSQQRGVLQQLFGLKDPLIQEALAEPANLGYIKNVLGLTELVIPGEDSRNKQLREIQVLLGSVPIVVHVSENVTRDSSVAGKAENPEGSPNDSGGTRDTEHGPRTVVLPSVPVDLLLDDHAVEFEECKRWANSEAGQSAKMTNPAGFANVRAHAEAHLRAMTTFAPPTDSSTQQPPAVRRGQVSPPPAPAPVHEPRAPMVARTPRESSTRADAERDGQGDHWVTINGNHVLISEPQGKQPAQAQPAASIKVLNKDVTIAYDPRLSVEEKLRASKEIAAAVDLLNKNADKLTDDEKKAIGEISSVFETASDKDKLGATGKGSMTLSKDYMEAAGVSAAWLASLFGHEGQHYLNSGKYSGTERWRDEQSASRVQLGIGNKIGFSPNERSSLQNWMDDKNRATMQEHMEKGYTY